MEFRYFFKNLVLPPCILIIAILMAWWLRHRKPKFSRIVFGVAIFGLWVLATPFAALNLEDTLVQHPFLVPEKLNAIQADAIVVLSASQIDQAPEFGQSVSGVEQLSRIRYGAFIHRRTGLPILLSGGSVRGGEHSMLSEAMAYDLLEGYGVKPNWLETKSRTTMENARNSYSMLAAENRNKIILVTSVRHMMRAVYSFEKAGFEVIAAPTGSLVRKPYTLRSFFPGAGCLYLSGQVLHEWLGYWVYRLF